MAYRTDAAESWPDSFGPSAGYLDTASSGRLTRSARDSILSAVQARFNGEVVDYQSVVESARSKYAQLLGIPIPTIAIGSQTSAAVSLIAANVGRLDSGDEVLCAKNDFGSVVYPFLALADAGEFTVKHVELNRLADSITDRTAVVAFSLVQSADGAVADSSSILQAARDAGAWTLVDVTQAAGWMPMGPGESFDPAQFDVTIAACYKWLCTPRGVVLSTFSDRAIRTLTPIQASWFGGVGPESPVYGPRMELAEDARRFDLSPAWPQFLALDAALDEFAGERIHQVHQHNMALAQAFCDGLELDATSSPIVSVPDPDERIARQAAEAGIAMASRLGLARFSFHLYNTPADVAGAVAAVRAAARSSR